ncbi:Gfo/Idh/MocA family protein [Acidithiobacillus sp. AC3]
MQPLRLGFIGGGLNSAVGYTHFNASRLDGHFRVVAGCFSRDEGPNRATAQTYGVAAERTWTSWQELVRGEQGNLDAVVILTPTPTHADIVLAFLDAGYPVICEKALAASSADCWRIDAKMRETGGYLAVTYNYSGYPMVRELRRMIRAGVLGELQQIHIEMPQEGYLRRGAKPQEWRLHDPGIPTVSLDLGVHVHHLVDFLTDRRQPVSVTGDQASYGPFPGIIDNVYCLARYQGDLRVMAWWGKTALGHRNGLRIRVYGRLASAEWYQMEPEILRWADNDGHHYMMDRGSSEALTAREPRYNRFKAGHPSGFVEAFANLYADIAAELRQYMEGEEIARDLVFDASDAARGMGWLEEVSRAAGTGRR